MPREGRLSAYLWSLLALAGGLLLTLAVHHQQRQRQLDEHRVALRMLAEKSYAGLQNRLQSSELLVRSVQSLFLSSDAVSATEFGHIYENLRPREQFPSLIAFAYANGESRPDGMHYITELVQPREGNESLAGLDINTQPANLAALLASRDSDQSVLSAPFELIQFDASKQPANGVTIRLPIYSPGAPPRSLAERRARMRGSIAVSFRVGQLIRLGLPDEALDALHIVVSDITDARVQPLFDSEPGRPAVPESMDRIERDLSYGGRVWSVAMVPKLPPPRLDWHESVLPAGLVISLLLMFLAWSVVGTQRRALALGLGMSQRYRESEKRFRALNELLPALVLLADVEDGRITYTNQAARDRLGDAIGALTLPMLFEDADLRLYLQQPDTPGWGNAEAMLQNGLGERFWASVSIARVLLDDREQLVMVASDITRQRELTELLSYQASHDALTELYNRREFERRLERALLDTAAGAPACALLYLDLDQFKLINDTSGHLAGDQLLAQLALVMRDHLGPSDVLARLGGDEFGVLLVGAHDRAAAEQMAERLRLRIDGYVFLWEQRSYTISVSIGGVMIDHPQITLKDLLAQADTACYMAKEQGRNRIHFYSEQDDETARRRSEMEWANRLRWAAEERRLLLTYQEVWPLSPAHGGGARIELLLRFRDEEGRLVVPGAFIPAAERYGLMPVIDRWVVETALANFDRLHPSGADLRLAAINLSGASIEDDSLVELIIDLLKRYRVDPSRVCFEITETVAVRHLARVAGFMERLRALGCKVALDDFGVGMSSFGYLKNLPVDIIKIDGSFIRDMLTDPVSHAMVRAVADIGHRLGLLVVAEWVTGQEIVDALVELGLDLAQGFNLHEPELVLFHRS
ncbi:diguanylate cyclase [Frateuria sp. Soil773]|nr:diguanylate cyclase [Frateuria sp. Soil773]